MNVHHPSLEETLEEAGWSRGWRQEERGIVRGYHLALAAQSLPKLTIFLILLQAFNGPESPQQRDYPVDLLSRNKKESASACDVVFSHSNTKAGISPHSKKPEARGRVSDQRLITDLLLNLGAGLALPYDNFVL